MTKQKETKKAEDLKGMDVVEKAKLCKKELREEFPNTKFSVRSKKYSGGSSFRVEWTDGPAESKVKEIVKKYEYHYPDEDRQSGYHHVDNYASLRRNISEEIPEKIADQIKPLWSDTAFREKSLEDRDFRQEVYEIIQHATFNQDKEITDLDKDNPYQLDIYEIEDNQIT